MKFDWQTDEDEKQWEREQSSVATPPRPSHRWLFLFLALAAIGLATFTVYRLVNRQAEQVTNTAEQQLLDSYHLLRQAAAQQDRELLFLILSGRDPAWTTSQRDLLLENLLFDRRPLGFHALPDTSQVISVTLSPELTTAELVYQQSYTVTTPAGLTETVRLQQTATFRRNPDRWLFSPPAATYWGEPAFVENGQLSLFHSHRDEAIARRLAADLTASITETCTLLIGTNMDCPHLTVHLDTDPATLLATADPTWLLQQGHIVTLPTPSLVGLPIDEAGYQALRRSYTLPVIAALFNQVIGWQCCDRLYFYQAMLDWQLAQLDLRPWPLTPADYETMIDGPLHYSELVEVWQLSEATTLSTETTRQLYTFVEYAFNHTTLASSVLEHRRLIATSSLFNWLVALFAPLSPDEDILFSADWQFFIYQRSLSAQQPPPIPLPDEEITLMCRSQLSTPGDNLHDLYQYNLAAATYTRTLAERPISYIHSLPNRPELLIVYYDERDDATWQQFWLYPGDENPIYEHSTAGGSHLIFDGTDPTGRQLILYSIAPQRGISQYALLDTTNCNPAGCTFREIHGRPVWSPDGSRALLAGYDDETSGLMVWTADGQLRGSTRLGPGYSPFWVDNETFGYIRVDLTEQASSGLILQTVVFSSIGSQIPPFSFTNETLLAAIPAESRTEGLFLNGIRPIPDGSGRLLLYTWDWSSNIIDLPQATHVFLIDPQTEAISWLPPRDELLLTPPIFSPDGHWLLMEATERLGLDGGLYLYSPDQNLIFPIQTDPLTSYGWSADSQWFWLVQNEYLYLLAPDHNYRLIRPLPLYACRQAISPTSAR